MRGVVCGAGSIEFYTFNIFTILKLDIFKIKLLVPFLELELSILKKFTFLNFISIFLKKLNQT